MLMGEWERIGKEVGEGKEWQMKGSRKGVREGVGGGGVEVWVGRRGEREGERDREG